MKFRTVLGTELLKLRRSWITRLSFLFYAFFGLIAWFMLWIARNPGAAQGLGLVGQKANFASAGLSADWTGLLFFLAEMNVAGAMIIFSFIVIWLFGREYVEGTAKNLLALPVPRSRFVLAKLCVALGWCALLTLFLALESLVVAAALGLGAPPAGLFGREIGNMFLAALLVFALEPITAWITVASANYLAPFGYTMATLIVANLMAHTGWARWCPWSAVALLGGLAGPRDTAMTLSCGIVIAVAFAAGLAAALLHQSRADNAQ
jgi:ABC-2 type transport system permease protein